MGRLSQKEDGPGLVETYRADRVADMLASRAAEWRPQNLLRLKNVGSYQWNQQLGLFDKYQNSKSISRGI